MSTYMNPVDKEFLEALYPQYLLKQPIALQLWSSYYEHKKLFYKSKTNELKNKNRRGSFNRTLSEGFDISKEDSLTPSNELDNCHINQLSPNTRREIWQNLRKLGVLGTMPYESASDHYVVQLYKYFYLGDKAIKFNSIGTGGSLRVHEEPADESAKRKSCDRNKYTTSDSDAGSDSRTNSNDSDNKNIASDSRSAGNINDDNDNIKGKNETETEQGDSKPEQNVDSLYYSNLGETKVPAVSKKNDTPVNIYDSLFYPLPTRWLQQPGNSVLLSNDGLSRISPNPHWKSYMKIESSENMSAYGRDRMKDTGMTANGQKYEYATTWSNMRVSYRGVGIYYYEIRVLNVSSSQGGANSNILVGYKLQLTNNPTNGPSADSNMDNAIIDNSVSSVHFMEMAHNSEETNEDPDAGPYVRPYITEPNDFTETGNQRTRQGISATRNEGKPIPGFYAYSGYDGKISGPRQIADYNEPFGRDDVIGCGINFIDGTIFYTKNGVHLGTAFRDVTKGEFIPAIALRPGNTATTNFGLYEEFVFDIMSYQNKLKLTGYEYIFNSLSSMNDDDYETTEKSPKNTNSTTSTSTNSRAFQRVGTSDSSSDSNSEDNDNDVEMDNDNEDNNSINQSESLQSSEKSEIPDTTQDKLKIFQLGPDTRIRGTKMVRPPTNRINYINTEDDSIPSTLNVLINDYLIHEGMIDVAKGFLNDLRKDANGRNGTDYSEDETSMVNEANNEVDVIEHNEAQIVGEEELLKMRYEIRKLIIDGEIRKCIEYISNELMGLLESKVLLLFDLKVSYFLLEIKKNDKPINEILDIAHDLYIEFAQNNLYESELRKKFEKELFNISGLLAYENPIKEAPEDLSVYLSDDYLQDRLFQVVNSNILDFLGKDSSCALNDVIGYTRAMLNTFGNYDLHRKNGKPRYYKLINIDEDILNI
ncbi:hypothetical protein C6P45_001874 [Maudiozyma exigua]|uniref:B30.2/SPRY domain-containing protein n=1 Tax=Maudiozyma exigua TaxID=34358 RepID=A0A9P7B4K0_MAUEX|nr:hypothetical protein C6P45_001874 [Kazachstania exigua]